MQDIQETMPMEPEISSAPVEGDGEVEGEEGQENGEEEEFAVSDDEVEVIVDHEQPDCYSDPEKEEEIFEECKRNLEQLFEKEAITEKTAECAVKGEDADSKTGDKGKKREMPQHQGLQHKKSRVFGSDGSGGKEKRAPDEKKEKVEVKTEEKVQTKETTVVQPDETPPVVSDEEKDPNKAEAVSTKGTYKDILTGMGLVAQSKGVLCYLGPKELFCRSSEKIKNIMYNTTYHLNYSRLIYVMKYS